MKKQILQGTRQNLSSLRGVNLGRRAQNSIMRMSLVPVLACAMIVLGAGAAKAAVLSWDAGGATPTNPTDGTGTWSATNANWSNGTTDAVWSANDAVIGHANGAAGTITVSGSLNVGNITFNAPTSGGYTLTGGTLALTSGTITDNNTLGATNINTVLAGSVGLTTAGSGTLVLGGANIYTGNTTLNVGTLQIGNGGTTGSISSSSTVSGSSGATLAFDWSNTTTFSNTISGTIGLKQIGSGTTVLAGSVSTKGPTAVNAGQLTIQNAAAWASGTTTIASGAVFDVNLSAGQTATVSGTFNGSGTLRKDGSGLWVVGASGVHDFFQLGAGGLIDIEGGGIQTNFTSTSFATNLASINIASGAYLDLYSENGQMDGLTGSGTLQNGFGSTAKNATIGVSNGSGTFAGLISGSGGGLNVVKTGNGTEVLTGSNTYAGSTTINNGVLQIGNGGLAGSGGWISASSTVTGSSTGTLAFNWSNSGTFANTISGSIGVTQMGSGATTLSANNTYTGNTTVSAGTLNVTGTLGSTAVSVANAATLQGTGKIGGLVTVSGGGIINLSAALQTLTLSNGLTIGNNTTPSVLDFAGSGSSFSLINATGSTLTVSGSTTINITGLAGLMSGTYNLITFTSSSGLGSFNLATTTIGSDTLSLASTSTSEEIVVTSTAPSAYWKGGNGTAWNATTPTNWTSDQAGTTGTSAPTSTTDVYFTANGVSTPLTTSLGTNFDIHGLYFNSTASNAVTISDATHNLTIEGDGINLAAGTGAHTISVNSLIVNTSQFWTNSSGSLFTVTNGITGAAGSGTTTTLNLAGPGTGGFLLSGAIGDGSGGGQLALTVSGASETAILTGNNTYTGPTTITSGTLQVGNGGTAGALSASGTIIDNGTLIFSRTNTVTQGTDFSSAAISGAGGIVQAGSGTLALTASNTYSGGTRISAGTVNINADAALGSGGITFSGAGVLQAGASSISLVSTRGITINSAVAGTIDTQGNNMTVNGTIGGAGSLIKIGTGTLTLAGVNSYSGTTTLSQGTLNIANTFSGGTITLGDANTGSNNLQLILTSIPGSNTVVSANGSGTDTITLPAQNLQYNGTITLNRSATLQANYSGGGGAYFETITGNLNGGTLTVQSPSSGLTYMGASNTFIGTVALPLGSVYTFTSGAFGTTNPVVMSGNSTLGLYNSPLTIDALTGATGNTILTNAFGNNTLTVSTSNSGTFAGVISGGGAFTKAGTGTEVLTGSNTYTGNTTINNGVVQIGNNGTSGALASSSTVTGSSGGTLAYDLSSAIAPTNTITGGIGVTQMGSGTLTLASTYAYTGATTVNLGNLSVTGTLSSSAATVTANASSIATLAGTGSFGGLVTTSGTSGSVGVAHIAPGVNTSGANNNFGVAGTLHLGAGLTIGNGTNLDFDLGTSSDLIAVLGTLNLGSNVVLNIGQGTGFSVSNTYTLINGGYTIGASGTTPLSTWTLGSGGPAGYNAVFSGAGGVVSVSFVPSNNSTLAITPSPISLGNVLVGYTPTSVSGTITNNGTVGTGTYLLVATGSASASGSGTLAAGGGATAFTVGTTGTLGGTSGNNKVIGTVYATNSANPSGSASPVNVTANLYQTASLMDTVSSGTNLNLTSGSSTDGGQRAGVTVSNFASSNPNFTVTVANGGSVGTATATNVTATVATVGVASNRLSGTYTYTGSVTGSAAYTDPNLQSQGGSSLSSQSWTGISITGTVTGATSNGTGQVKQAYVASGNSYTGYGLTSAVSGGFGQPSHPTVATILASDNASGNTTVNMNFSANGGHAVNAFQASDTLTLSGINPIGGNGPDGGSILTDTFVLQMSYVLNANDTGYYIGWWDANAPRGGAWVNAIAGNSNAVLPRDYIGTGAYMESYTAFNMAFLAAHPGDTLDNELGAYGYDPTTDTAWAVLDHNSDFEVIPEPSTYAMIFGGFGLLIGFQNMRRRR